MFHVSSFKSFERPFLRAGQAVKSVRPENKFLVPCEHSLTLSLTMQRYESFIAVYECLLLFLWKKLWEIMINSTFAWLNWTRRYEETKGYHRLKRIISWEILRFLKGHEASYRGFAKQNLRAFVSSCSIINHKIINIRNFYYD